MTYKDEIEHLFRLNYMPMLILAVRILRDKDAAKDIVHDIFSSLFNKNLSVVNTPYLLNAVRFACLKYLRNQTLRERFFKSYALEMEKTDNNDWPNDEDIVKLKKIIDKHLPEKTREILILKFINKLKYREIADKLSLSEVSVYKHLRNAYNILRQYLDNDER